MSEREIVILQGTAADHGEPAECKLARLVVELTREGIAFTVGEDVAPHFSGLSGRLAYVIKITGF